MISFELTESQTMVRDVVRELAKRELRERARACDEASRCPQELLDKSWQLGLVSAAIPEALGGGGSDGAGGEQTTHAIVLEELGYGCASLGAMLMAPLQLVRPLLDFGTDEQKKEYLPLFTGERYRASSIALHEPHFGFDPAELRTTAVRRGDHYVLRGEKHLVPMADQSSHFLVIARGNEPGLSGLSAFIVPRDAPGLVVHEEIEQTIGFQAMPWGRLSLNDLHAPLAFRLGGERGIDGARLLASLRVGGAALCVGLARAVTELAIGYAKERVAFGEPIAKKQAIAFMIADMYTEVESMRWLVWKAASELERGVDATRSSVIAQDYVSRKTMKVADDGIQVFGGHGFIRDYPLELWFRNARVLTMHEGPVCV
jgi:alkylation response protein AidB-like acyl-CoA dehydrogenase